MLARPCEVGEEKKGDGEGEASGEDRREARGGEEEERRGQGGRERGEGSKGEGGAWTSAGWSVTEDQLPQASETPRTVRYAWIAAATSAMELATLG